MFVIVHNNSVILGPMRWNRYRFENVIQEDLDLDQPITLPDTNGSNVITVNDEVTIYPVLRIDNEEFNPKIQHLHGPFWEFTDVGAIGSYIAQDLSIDAVKNQLKAEIANQRWLKENEGTYIRLNDVEYPFATTKENRSILHQAITSNTTELNWKISTDQWIILTQQDIKLVFDTIFQHVQWWFDWELRKFNEIDNCTTLQQLNDVVTNPG